MKYYVYSLILSDGTRIDNLAYEENRFYSSFPIYQLLLSDENLEYAMIIDTESHEVEYITGTCTYYNQDGNSTCFEIKEKSY